MADTIREKRFALPVYKGDASGDLIEAGDTLSVLKYTAGSESLTSQNITVISVNERADIIRWEYDAGNLYIMPDDIHSVAAAHQWECPEPENVDNTGAHITATVTSFTIDGDVTAGSWPVTADGASDLMDALNEALAVLGDRPTATVVYVDAGTDYLVIYVTQTLRTVIINATTLS